MAHRCNYPGCEKSFDEKKRLTRHEKTHTKKTSVKEFKCTVCSKPFGRDDVRKKHEKSHTSTFSCTVCLKTFANDANRKTHEKTHESKKCKYCGQLFSRSDNRAAHERNCGSHGHGVRLRN